MSFFSDIKNQLTSLKLNIKDKLFILLIFTAFMGAGISYGKVYLFYLIILFYIAFNLFFTTKEFLKRFIELFKFRLISNGILLLIVLFFFVRLPFSDHLSYSIRHFFFLTAGVTLIFLIQEYVNSRKTLYIFLISCGCILSIDLIIGLLETLQLFRWPISSLSEYNNLFARSEILSSILSETKHKSYINSMPTSFHWNPNNYATCILLGLPFVLISKKFKIAAPIILLIIILIIAAGSRSSYLGVIVIFFFSLFFIKRNLVNISFLFIVLLLISTNGFNQFRESSMKVDEIQNFVYGIANVPQEESVVVHSNEEESVGYRSILIEKGLDLFKNNPLFGVGGGNAQAIIELEGGVGKKRITNLHNFWLELVVEGGLFLGILLLIWLIYQFFFILKTIFDTDPRSFLYYLNVSGFLTATGLFISGIGPSGMISFFPFYIFIAYLSVLNFFNRNDELKLKQQRFS